MTRKSVLATIRGTMLAPGVSKNNRLYTREAIGRMVKRAQERINDTESLPIVMRTHHAAGDDSRQIIGRITKIEQDADGRANYEAKLFNNTAARDLAPLLTPDEDGKSALRTTSIYGYWLGGVERFKQGKATIETGDDLEVDALDFTATPGVGASRIDSIAFESTTHDGKRIVESADVTVTFDAEPVKEDEDDEDDDDLEVASWIGEDYTAAQRQSMAGRGQAMSGGRYPVANKADLRKAIRAVGRGNGSHEAIRKHIMARAKALGLTSMIPNAWKADGTSEEVAHPPVDFLTEASVEICISDEDGNPLIRICAADCDPGLLKKTAKKAGKIASKILKNGNYDPDDDADDDVDVDMNAGTDPDSDPSNPGFAVAPGSDPQYMGGSGESLSYVIYRDGVKLTEFTDNQTSDSKSEEPTTEESVVPDETKTQAVDQAAPAGGLSEADLAKLGALIGASVSEAMNKMAAAMKAKAKAKKNKNNDAANADAADESTKKSGKAPVAETVITNAEFEKRLTEERAKMTAELRETIIKESGLPARRGYRHVEESDTDVNPTGDDLWDKRAEVWANFFPWGKNEPVATDSTAA